MVQVLATELATDRPPEKNEPCVRNSYRVTLRANWEQIRIHRSRESIAPVEKGGLRVGADYEE